MGACKLDLYDGFNYSGHLATFTSSAYNGNSNSNDRDASGKVTGDCKNTTWLGFEHPGEGGYAWICLLYTSPSPRDLSTSRMPSSA